MIEGFEVEVVRELAQVEVVAHHVFVRDGASQGFAFGGGEGIVEAEVVGEGCRVGLLPIDVCSVGDCGISSIIYTSIGVWLLRVRQLNLQF